MHHGTVDLDGIRRHTAAILSRETKKSLFYHAKPRSGNHGGEAWRGKTKLFWSPGTIWPPCDKGEWSPDQASSSITTARLIQNLANQAQTIYQLSE